MLADSGGGGATYEEMKAWLDGADEGAVAAMAAAWTKVSNALGEHHLTLQMAMVDNLVPAWTGEASDAYLAKVQELAVTSRAASESSSQVSTAVSATASAISTAKQSFPPPPTVVPETTPLAGAAPTPPLVLGPTPAEQNAAARQAATAQAAAVMDTLGNSYQTAVASAPAPVPYNGPPPSASVPAPAPVTTTPGGGRTATYSGLSAGGPASVTSASGSAVTTATQAVPGTTSGAVRHPGVSTLVPTGGSLATGGVLGGLVHVAGVGSPVGGSVVAHAPVHGVSLLTSAAGLVNGTILPGATGAAGAAGAAGAGAAGGAGSLLGGAGAAGMMAFGGLAGGLRGRSAAGQPSGGPGEGLALEGPAARAEALARVNGQLTGAPGASGGGIAEGARTGSPRGAGSSVVELEGGSSAPGGGGAATESFGGSGGTSFAGGQSSTATSLGESAGRAGGGQPAALGEPGTSGSGTLGAEPAAGGTAAEPAGRSAGGSGMPMGSSGGGLDGAARRRTTWLVETDDVWSEDDRTAPPVIGS